MQALPLLLIRTSVSHDHVEQDLELGSVNDVHITAPKATKPFFYIAERTSIKSFWHADNRKSKLSWSPEICVPAEGDDRCLEHKL